MDIVRTEQDEKGRQVWGGHVLVVVVLSWPDSQVLLVGLDNVEENVVETVIVKDVSCTLKPNAADKKRYL